jgi:hypothetical protein
VHIATELVYSCDILCSDGFQHAILRLKPLQSFLLHDSIRLVSAVSGLRQHAVPQAETSPDDNMLMMLDQCQPRYTWDDETIA